MSDLEELILAELRRWGSWSRSNRPSSTFFSGGKSTGTKASLGQRAARRHKANKVAGQARKRNRRG